MQNLKHIDTLANVASSLMDGQPVPAAGPKIEQIAEAIRELQKCKSTQEFEFLGHKLLGVLIDRIGSDLHAQPPAEDDAPGQ